jgi:hypothetical protein
MYRYLIFLGIVASFIYCAEVDFIVSTKGFYEKINAQNIVVRENSQTVNFIVAPNLTKDYSLNEICYIRFKNNKNILVGVTPRIELSTGEIIASTIENSSEETITISKPDWYSSKLSIDFKFLRKIIFTPITTTEEETTSDVIVFKNTDIDKGTIMALSKDSVEIKSKTYSNQLKKYNIKDIAEIHFVEVPVEQSGSGVVYVAVNLGDGSKIIGKLKKIEVEKATIESIALGVVDIPLMNIHSIYTLNSKCVHLSDLPFKGVATYSKFLKKVGIYRLEGQKAFYEKSFRVKRDCSSVECQPIELAYQRFPKGLGIHTTTVIKIELDKKYKKFFSFYGIDFSVLNMYNSRLPGAHAFLRIYGDKKLLFKKDNIKLSDKLNFFVIDVSNIKTLKIVVKEPPFPRYKDIFVLGRFSLALPILVQ